MDTKDKQSIAFWLRVILAILNSIAGVFGAADTDTPINQGGGPAGGGD